MMFRRPRRLGMRRAIARNIRRQFFTEADQLSAAGQPEQAARQFADMAVQMEREGKLRQAANLHTQAAHRWLDAVNSTNAMQEAQSAQALFTKTGMAQRAMEFKARFSAHLKQQGLQAEADQVENMAIPQSALPDNPDLSPKQRRLPATCPQCGAPVHSNEVVWLDDASAECDFCGSTILTLN